MADTAREDTEHHAKKQKVNGGTFEAEVSYHVPDELQAAQIHVLPLIKAFRSLVAKLGHHQPSGARSELSVVFGGGGGGEGGGAPLPFSVGSSGLFFKHRLKMMQRFADWKSVHTVCSHEYFYPINDTPICTTTVFGPDKIAVRHDSRVLTQHVVFSFQEEALRGLHVRVAVKRVDNVPVASLPVMIRPQGVRIRKQTTFVMRNWSFQFVREWSAPTRAEAEEKQAGADYDHEYDHDADTAAATVSNGSIRNGDTAPLTYKVKIIYTGSVTETADLSDEYLALSLLFKICSLMGGGNIFCLHPVV